MKIREELLGHPDWWKSEMLTDLNETIDEFQTRLDYLHSIQPNPKAIAETTIGDDEKLDYESIDEYRARIRNDYLLTDMDVDEKAQDGYYFDEENIKKDMLKGLIPFDKEWYGKYLNRNSSQ